MALNFLNDGYFAGKVGIGTESPSAKLHVNPTTTDEIAIAINGTQNYSAGEFQRIAAGDASSLNRLSIGFGYDNPTDWAIRYSSYGRHEFYTGNDWGNAANTEKMVITSAGNVGIGTDDPGALLEISGIRENQIRLTSRDTTAAVDETIGGIEFYSSDSGNEGVKASISAIAADAAGSAYMTFNTGTNVERMRITSTGGVSFGSTGTAYGTSGQILKSNGNASPTWIDGSAIPGVPAGSGTLNYLAKWTPDGDTLGIGSVFDNGNVGIGTINPQSKLHVDGDIRRELDGTSTIGFGSGSTSVWYSGMKTVDFGAQNIGLTLFTTTNAGTTNVDALTIDEDGNVGIGMTAPAAKLQVIESGSNNTAIFENSGQTYSYTAIKVAEALNNKAALSFAVGNALASTDIFGEISGSVTNNGGALTGDLVFKTNPGDNITERMRILANGNVGIGTTSPSAFDALADNFVINAATSAGMTISESTGAGTSNILFAATSSFANRGNITYDHTATAMTFGINASEKMRIDSSGNVGIGTSPNSYGNYTTLTIGNASGTGSILDIEYQTIRTLSVYAASNGGNINVIAAKPLILLTSAAERMRILATGQIGMGTTSPTEKLEVVGNIKITAAVLSNQENADVDTGTETVAEFSAAAFTAGFFDFVIKKTTNVRSGTVYACHDGTSVAFTETSTQDLGDTSDVTLSVDISGGSMRLRATTTSDDWSVKSLIRAI